MLTLVKSRHGSARRTGIWSLKSNDDQPIALSKDLLYAWHLFSTIVDIDLSLELKDNLFLFDEDFPSTFPKGEENNIILRLLVDLSRLAELGEDFLALRDLLFYRDKYYHQRRVRLFGDDGVKVIGFLRGKGTNLMFRTVTPAHASLFGVKMEKPTVFHVSFTDSPGYKTLLFRFRLSLNVEDNYRMLHKLPIEVKPTMKVLPLNDNVDIPYYDFDLLPNLLEFDFGDLSIFTDFKKH